MTDIVNLSLPSTPLFNWIQEEEPKSPKQAEGNVAGKVIYALFTSADGLSKVIKLSGKLFTLGGYACQFSPASEGAGIHLEQFGKEFSRVGDGMDLFGVFPLLSAEINDEVELQIKNMGIAETTFNAGASILQPVLFFDSIGVYTLGFAGQVMGWVQTGFGLTADTISLASISYDLSITLQKEQQINTMLERVQTSKAEPSLIQKVTDKLTEQLTEIKEAVKEKIFNLVKKIIDIVSQIFSIVASFIMPIVFVPIAIILALTSISMGIAQFCQAKIKEEEAKKIEQNKPKEPSMMVPIGMMPFAINV